MILPDVNVWLALAFESHVHHSAAKSWLDQALGPISFCRLTQQGLLRLATNQRVFGEEAVGMDQAWALYDSFLADQRIFFLSEPSDLEPVWRKLVSGESAKSNVWSDAYLAAFALVSELELVTFDSGFLEFDSLAVKILTTK